MENAIQLPKGVSYESKTFEFDGRTYEFVMQDNASRVEERDEVFEKLVVTPKVPNGMINRYLIQKFSWQVRRAARNAVIREFFSPGISTKAFPRRWNETAGLNSYGWISRDLLKEGEVRTHKVKLPTADGRFIKADITNPYHYVGTARKTKSYMNFSEWVELTQITRGTFSARNDYTMDKWGNMENATLLYEYRSMLVEGYVFEIYPLVEIGHRKDGSGSFFKQDNQNRIKELYIWMSLVENGKLDMDTASEQYYNSENIRNQAYARGETARHNGSVTEDDIEMIDSNTVNFATGQEVVKHNLIVKVEGVETDLSDVPPAVYKAMVNGKELKFNTTIKNGRLDLVASARENNGNLNLILDEVRPF